VLLLVPHDPLQPRNPDEYFAPEAEAARERGLDVAVVDDDALRRGDAAGALARVPHGSGEAVYRGWMVRSEEYAALDAALGARGAGLRTSPDTYRRAHELPGWYGCVGGLTPASVWLERPGLDGFDAALRRLGSGPAVVKDYVKSEKHRWEEAMFVPDAADAAGARAVAERFLELRGDDLVGGLVLRRFERYVGAEARTWWVDDCCALVTAHPDRPDEAPPAAVPLEQLAPAVAALGSRFVTVDVALREDGVWRVVEVGDGQVSDRPATLAPAELLRALLRSPQPPVDRL
jgi:hypothetical protein